jgi:hypothetical protein
MNQCGFWKYISYKNKLAKCTCHCMVFFLALITNIYIYIKVNGDRALNLTVYLFIYLFITRQGLLATAVLEAVSKVLIGSFYFTIIGSPVRNLCRHSSPRLAFPHFASQIFQPLFFRRIYKMLKYWALIQLIKRILIAIVNL